MTSIEQQLMSGEKLLTTKQVAALLHRTVAGVQTWRYRGGGPPFVKVGSRYLYPERAMWAWAEAQNQNGTVKNQEEE